MRSRAPRLRRLVASGALAVAAALAPARAFGHGMEVDYELAGGGLEIAVFYAPDTPAARARVVVTTMEATLVHTGETDEQGKLRLDVGAVSSRALRVVAIHDAHRIEVLVPLDAGAAAKRSRGRRPWERIVLGIVAIAAVFAAAGVLRKRLRGRGAAPSGPDLPSSGS